MAKSKVKVIEARTIRKTSSNGGISAQELFTIGDSRYRINIHTESVNRQSYAKLYKWTDKEGFELVISKDPSHYYGQCPTSYSQDWERKCKPLYEEIFNDLVSLAEKFEG